MNLTIYNDDIIIKLNQSIWPDYQQTDLIYRQIAYFYQKSLSYFQIIEICFLILLIFEHTIIFILTFQKKTSKRNQKEQKLHTILLSSKLFLYSCLHRNWIRAFSFSNICLLFIDLLILILKHYHPKLFHYTSVKFSSLLINLLQQILINFSTFHLFIMSISVFQYFLRYYRLLKNRYSTYFFNGQNLLLTKHTNVALILSGSLSLIFAYNFIFYTPKQPQTITLLPLITFNMILLPLINVIIFLFILICFIINFCCKSNLKKLPFDNEQENLRLIIEKNTCIKCYSKILQKNPNLFQDKNSSYKNCFSTRLRLSYPFQTKRNHLSNKKKNYSQNDFSSEEQNILENHTINNSFFKTTLIKLNHQHSLCHSCYYLLLIFLFKYILLTFPQYIFQMIFHLKQFYLFILQNNLSEKTISLLYDNNDYVLKICHYLYLLSRFGDSFLLIRLSYLIKKYFPCWCHFNSKLLRKQQTSHQILTTNNSESSNNEPIITLDMSNSNDLQQQHESMKIIHWKTKHHRYRLRFQFVPFWSVNRPRLFKENI